MRSIVTEGDANIIVTFVLERDINQAADDVREKSAAPSVNSSPLEMVSETFMKMPGPLIPANYRAIGAAQVARTLLERTPLAEGRVVVLSGEMQRC